MEVQKSIEILLPDDPSNNIDCLVTSWKDAALKIESTLNAMDYQYLANSEDEDVSPLNVSNPSEFQLIRTIGPSKTSIRSVCLMGQNAEATKLATVDSHFLHIWNGQHHTAKESIQNPKGKSNEPISNISGLEKLLFLNNWKYFLVSTNTLQLKIVDQYFKLICSISVPKAILSLEFVQESTEIVAGHVGKITIYPVLNENQNMRAPELQIGEPREISDFGPDEWIMFTATDFERNKLIAAYASNIHIYNYKTGKRVQKLNNIHKDSISALILWNETGLWITGSKDGSIRVWSQQNCLLLEMLQHSDEITGLGLVRTTTGPYLVSCSLDQTIRMWNIDDGRCTNKMNYLEELQGIYSLKSNGFVTYSDTQIQIWTVNRFFSLFCPLWTPLMKLKRISHPEHPSRILGISNDGSLSIFSTRTGRKLMVSFPTDLNMLIIDGIYDPVADLVYLLGDSGCIAVFLAKSSTCVHVDSWVYHSYQEVVTCMSALQLSKDLQPTRHYHIPMHYSMLLCGTESGQIVSRNIRNQGSQHVVLQAHNEKIVDIYCHSKGEYLITAAKDGCIKVFKIDYRQNKNGEIPIPDVKNRAGKMVCMALNLMSIHKPNSETDISPSLLNFDESLNILSFVTGNNQIKMFQLLQNRNLEEIKNLAPYEGHKDRINSSDISSTLALLVTASSDGILKIWDIKKNLLIREIQFQENIHSAIFLNERGDLLVCLLTEILLIKVHDYAPPEILRKLLNMNFSDDIIETPEKFDEIEKEKQFESVGFQKLRRHQNNNANFLTVMENLRQKELQAAEFLQKSKLKGMVPIAVHDNSGVAYENMWEEHKHQPQNDDSLGPVKILPEASKSFEKQAKIRIYDEIEREGGYNYLVKAEYLDIDNLTKAEQELQQKQQDKWKALAEKTTDSDDDLIDFLREDLEGEDEEASGPAETKNKKADGLAILERNRKRKKELEAKQRKARLEEKLKKMTNDDGTARANAQGLFYNLEEIEILKKKTKDLEDQLKARELAKAKRKAEEKPKIENAVETNAIESEDSLDIPLSTSMEKLLDVKIKSDKEKEKRKKKRKSENTRAGASDPTDNLIETETLNSKKQSKTGKAAKSSSSTTEKAPKVKKPKEKIAGDINNQDTNENAESSSESSEYEDEIEYEDVKLLTIAEYKLPEYDNYSKYREVGIESEEISFSASLGEKKMKKIIVYMDPNRQEKDEPIVEERNVVKDQFDIAISRMISTNKHEEPETIAQIQPHGKENVFHPLLEPLVIRPMKPLPQIQSDDLKPIITTQPTQPTVIEKLKKIVKKDDNASAKVAWGLFKAALLKAAQKKDNPKSYSNETDLLKIMGLQGKYNDGIISEEQVTLKLPFQAQVDAKTSQSNLLGFDLSSNHQVIPPIPAAKKATVLPLKHVFKKEDLSAYRELLNVDNRPIASIIKEEKSLNEAKLLRMEASLISEPGMRSDVSYAISERLITEEQKSDEKVSGLALFGKKIAGKKVEELPNKEIEGSSLQIPQVQAPVDEHETELLNEMTEISWINRLSNLENITVESVVRSLNQVVLSEESEKIRVEAAQFINLVIETFGSDIIELKEHVVSSNATILQNAPDNLKLQIISNLGSMKIKTDEVLVNLIACLDSKNPSVVEAAISSLSNFGVNSKQDLKQAMLKCRMLDSGRLFTPKTKFKHPLDKFLESMHKEERRRLISGNCRVERWRNTLDKRIYGKPVERPDSTFITLVPHLEQKVLGPLKAARKRSQRFNYYR